MAKQESGGLQQLFLEEIRDLLDAEKQLVKALPKMAKSATDEELETALREHLEVTRGQVQRLEEVFGSMDERPRGRTCRGMQGIVEEGQQMLGEEQEEMALDSAITGAARKVEHYEIASYETARSLAQQLGMRDAAQLLQETLQEEMQADRQLAQISKRLLKSSSSRSRATEAESSDGRRSSGRSSSSRGRRTSAASSRSRSGSASSRSRRTSASSSRRAPRGSQRNAGGSGHPLIDHDEIRQWAEERAGTPACVKGTGNRGDIGMIRLDFPGYSGAQSLQPISWDEWFEKFDERGLALIVQDRTGRGQKSNFNKLVSRETVEQRPRARAAR